MKKTIFVAIALLLSATMATYGQEKSITNRYSMKLKANDDGTYSLLSPKKYRIDLNDVPDLLVPYEPQSIVSKKEYGSCISTDYVYKTYPEYTLSLTVDSAVSDEPAPFMVYIHGGGWARGSRDSARTLSQYLAVQHGIAGVRISYTLAGQPDASVEVSIDDVRDAVRFIQEHAEELGIDPQRFGFYGSSAGGHLAAAAAMTVKEADLMVGYAGIYDLTTAAITTRAKDPVRIAYFGNLSKKVLVANSPQFMIPRKNLPAAMLVCGTGDSVVEYEQSVEFDKALRNRGGETLLLVYPYYDHNIGSKSSDKSAEIFWKTVEFVTSHLAPQP